MRPSNKIRGKENRQNPTMEAEIQKHERMAAPDVDGDEGLGPVGNEAFEVRDRLATAARARPARVPTEPVPPS